MEGLEGQEKPRVKAPMVSAMKVVGDLGLIGDEGSLMMLLNTVRDVVLSA